MDSLVYPIHTRTRTDVHATRSQCILTKATLYYYKYCETTTRTYNKTCMIDGGWGSSHRRQYCAIITQASCCTAWVLLKPFTMIVDENNSFGTQRMPSNGVRATQFTALRTRATENHCANPLPFKARVVSETTTHDPTRHNKVSQMRTPTTTLLFTTIKSG